MCTEASARLTLASRCEEDSLVCIQGSTGVCTAKFKSGEEEVQKAVRLAFPSVAIEEDADPGHHTLK